VPIRLSAAEREQIKAASSRLELTLSGFIRQAALEASARVEQKATPWWARAQQVATTTAARKHSEPEPKPEPHELVVVDAEPHYVDGEPVYR
jgi:hypothetical protein